VKIAKIGEKIGGLCLRHYCRLQFYTTTLLNILSLLCDVHCADLVRAISNHGNEARQALIGQPVMRW